MTPSLADRENPVRMIGTAPRVDATDDELARSVQARERSPDAWKAAHEACLALYDRHASQLLGFLANRMKRSDIEDAHQAIWEKIWNVLPGSFSGGSFRSWVFEIARNHVIDLSRKKRPEPMGEAEVQRPDPRGPSPEEPVLEAERKAILERCLGELAPAAAGVVRSRLIGEDYDSICDRLSLKPAQAHKILHQAKEALARCCQGGVP